MEEEGRRKEKGDIKKEEEGKDGVREADALKGGENGNKGMRKGKREGWRGRK